MAIYEWVRSSRKLLIVRVADDLHLETEIGRNMAWLGVPEGIRMEILTYRFDGEYHRNGRWAIFCVKRRVPLR